MLGHIFPDIEISVQLLKLAENLLALFRLLVPVIVNLFLQSGDLRLQFRDFLLKLLEHFFWGGIPAP